MKAVIEKEYIASKGCSECRLYLSDSTNAPVITRQHIIFYIPYDDRGTIQEVRKYSPNCKTYLIIGLGFFLIAKITHP